MPSIRHASAADLPAVVAIYNAAIPGRMSTADTEAVTVAQREGVARRLLAHALSQCPGLGIANVLAFVFAHNMPSVTLFEAHGFGRWGLLPKICEIDGQEHDVLILGIRV